MARTDTLGNFLTDVAEAIRTKKGTTDTIVASEFDTEIANLPSGGSEPEKGIIITEWNSDGYPTAVKIKDITEIPAYAFGQTATGKGIFEKLITVELPEDITKIGEGAFSYLMNLVITEIPSTITSLPSSCFWHCESIQSLTFLGNITWMTNMSVRECTSLEEVIFEGSATGIQNTVFYGCTNLTKIVFKNNTEVPTLNHSNSFSSTPIASGTGYIYIADDLVETMKTTTNWSTYANQIKPLSELEASE